MSLTRFQLQLGYYAGPIDLLLYLVRKRELEITTISLAKVTRDFQEYLTLLQMLDLDLVGEFIVVASTLLEIKSREVLPVPEVEEQEDAVVETSSDLIAQLIQYKRYKNAAAQLNERAADWLERYPRLSIDRPDTKRDYATDKIREVELWDLVSALSRIVKLPEVESQTTIRMDETPISEHQLRIRQRLTECGRVAFSEFFEGEKLQSRIVGIFQATLELIRHEAYRAEQPVMFGEIYILPPKEQPAAEKIESTDSENSDDPAE